MPAQAIAVRAARVRAVGFFSAAHPVAGWAAHLCRSHPVRSLAHGLVACGWCWETAIRDHERRRLDPQYMAAAVDLPTARVPLHFNPSHPLARPADWLCRSAGHGGQRVGRVACGSCWEQAIRLDEQVVVEHGLDRYLVVDHGLVDEVAVRLACSGERVELTEAERAAAVERLLAQGVEPDEVAARLRIAVSVIASTRPVAEVRPVAA